MQNTLLKCTAVFCALAVAAGFASNQINVRARTGFGRVIDAGTGRPIEGVSVAVLTARIGTQTGTNGAFRLNQIPADSTHLDFRHPCYFPVSVTVPARGDQEIEIEIGMPFDAASLQRPGCGGLGARGKRDTPR
jgi:hypothetical protein